MLVCQRVTRLTEPSNHWTDGGFFIAMFDDTGYSSESWVQTEENDMNRFVWAWGTQRMACDGTIWIYLGWYLEVKPNFPVEFASNACIDMAVFFPTDVRKVQPSSLTAAKMWVARNVRRAVDVAVFSFFWVSEVSNEECKKGVEMPLVVLGRWFNTIILGKLLGPLGGSLNAKWCKQ